MSTLSLEPQSLDDVRALARSAAASKLFGVASEDAALMLMLTGASLGIPAVAALRGIHIVQNRPVLSADMIVSIVRRSGLCESWRIVESTPERCAIETRRKGESEPARHEWTLAMAKRAGLGTKTGPWQQFPHAMLRARCAAELARMVYPDVLFGVYAEGEIAETPARVAVVRQEYAALEAPADDGLAEALASARGLSGALAAWSSADRTTEERAQAWLDAVAGWVAERLDVLPTTDLRPLLQNAASATDDFCALFDALVSAPDVDAVLAAWRKRGDMGGKWFDACAYRMTGRTLRTLGVSTQEAKRLLMGDPEPPKGDGPHDLSTVTSRAIEHGEAEAVERLGAIENRTHLYNSARRHAEEILSTTLVRDLYAATLRRITPVDAQDTRSVAELDRAACDLVTMWATEAVKTSAEQAA